MGAVNQQAARAADAPRVRLPAGIHQFGGGFIAGNGASIAAIDRLQRAGALFVFGVSCRPIQPQAA